MRILMINSTNFGSTGNIMLQVADKARERGNIVYTSCPASRDNRKKDVEYQILIGNRFFRNLHLVLGYLTGLNGCFSFLSTINFLRKVKKINPDIMHLHNLHNCYINLGMLFKYIKKNKIRVVWTLHDCWSFTGDCPHFDIVNCCKWKTECNDCPSFKEYPASIVDNSKYMYRLKKKWFTGVKDLNIVTPSKWLGDLVKQSFLKDYPVNVINNGIDLNVFKPTESDFRKKYGCEDKLILLGVAFGWGERKGLDVFIELSKRLDDRFQIVLVGTDENVDKQLPKNIISIHRTQNQTELAEIYTAADLFVNPTREEVFGLVNSESLACGTPVITFRTGGSPEIPNDTCGVIVAKNDNDEIYEQIIKICSEKKFSLQACLERAKSFDMCDKYNEYLDLYERQIND